MEKALAYVDGWDKAYASNTGLLLFGDVGTGKSFFAGCIANALLDRDVSVMMTNFPTILSRLTGMFPVYSRILEHCVPILFSGQDIRKDNADTTKITLKRIFQKNPNNPLHASWAAVTSTAAQLLYAISYINH